MRIMAVLFLFARLFLSAGLALAQPKHLGRLSDGRAYRIADDGVEIVDQLADFELKVWEQERRIKGLEDELESKNSLLQRLNSAAVSTLKEKDVLSKNAGGCESELVDLKARIRSLELKLANLSDKLVDRDVELYKLKSSKSEGQRAAVGLPKVLSGKSKVVSPQGVVSDFSASHRSELKRKFSKTRRLFKARVQLYNENIKSKSGVVPELRELRSSKGVTWEQLSSKSLEISFEEQMTAISEIQRLLEEDIALLKRLHRL